MMDDNLVYWIDNVRSAVLAVDPSATRYVWAFSGRSSRILHVLAIHG